MLVFQDQDRLNHLKLVKIGQNWPNIILKIDYAVFPGSGSFKSIKIGQI